MVGASQRRLQGKKVQDWVSIPDMTGQQQTNPTWNFRHRILLLLLLMQRVHLHMCWLPILQSASATAHRALGKVSRATVSRQVKRQGTKKRGYELQQTVES